MDDSTGRNTQEPKADFTLGMSSFGDKEREQLGQKLRLATACIEGSVVPSPGKAMPSDAPAISQRLKSLTQEISSSLADVLELLDRFDELKVENRQAPGTVSVDRASFDSVRKLSPTRYRFRVVNSDGIDIRDFPIEESLTTQNISNCATDIVDDSTRADDSTRVECAETASESYRYESSDLRLSLARELSVQGAS